MKQIYEYSVIYFTRILQNISCFKGFIANHCSYNITERNVFTVDKSFVVNIKILNKPWDFKNIRSTRYRS